VRAHGLPGRPAKAAQRQRAAVARGWDGAVGAGRADPPRRNSPPPSSSHGPRPECCRLAGARARPQTYARNLDRLRSTRGAPGARVGASSPGIDRGPCAALPTRPESPRSSPERATPSSSASQSTSVRVPRRGRPLRRPRRPCGLTGSTR
jgi:hypothetical protein